MEMGIHLDLTKMQLEVSVTGDSVEYFDSLCHFFSRFLNIRQTVFAPKDSSCEIYTHQTVYVIHSYNTFSHYELLLNAYTPRTLL